jgi:phage-related protein
VCGKRVESCKLRFGATAELPFGSYPGAGLVQ